MNFDYEKIKQNGADIINGRYSDFNKKRLDASLFYEETLAELRLNFEDSPLFADFEKMYADFSQTINKYIEVFNNFRMPRNQNPHAFFLNPTEANNSAANAINTADVFLNQLINGIIRGTNEIRSKCTTKQIYVPELYEHLKKVAIPSEIEYLSEAANCLKNGYFKAAVVLGWCATINRIHLKIEQIGFDKFNTASLAVKKQFNKHFTVNSISELREVFDNCILGAIEEMRLIDGNQRKRLKNCFDMRCQSAHPGDAPITKPNVISFFSDIIEIVLANKNFELVELTHE